MMGQIVTYVSWLLRAEDREARDWLQLARSACRPLQTSYGTSTRAGQQQLIPPYTKGCGRATGSEPWKHQLIGGVTSSRGSYTHRTLSLSQLQEPMERYLNTVKGSAKLETGSKRKLADPGQGQLQPKVQKRSSPRGHSAATLDTTCAATCCSARCRCHSPVCRHACSCRLHP